MFGWKKKKQAAAVPHVEANGKPEGQSKKKRGTGSLSQISKLFGSQSDGINKSGGESPSSRKPGLLKSSKKKQAPPPPGKSNAPQIVITDGHSKPDKDESFHDALTSPDISRVTTPYDYKPGNNDRFSNGSSYHNGGSNADSYSVSATSTNSSEYGPDVRNNDLTSHGDAPVREYALRPVEEWEEDDVLEWLADIGLDYFVDMFQECGIDGEYILSVTEEDLVELEVDDAELRQSLLTAISDAATGNLPKTTMVVDTPSNDARINDDIHKDSADTRKHVDSFADSQDSSDLEFSDPELPDDGDLLETNHPHIAPKDQLTLPSLDGDQDSEELESFNVDEEDSEEIASGEKEDGEVETFNQEMLDGDVMTSHLDDEEDMSILVETPVEAWEEPQVLVWLSAIGLGHLRLHFKGHNLTGNELLNIDMQFLDEMQVTSKDDRELLLSHLYQLNNPAANIPQNDTISAINESSGYQREKFMAAVTVLQSLDPDGAVQLLPPDNTLAMEALTENPASPEGGSRETSPRSLNDSKYTPPGGSKQASPEGSKHTSPSKQSPRSREDRQYTSPRSEGGSKQTSPRSVNDGKQTNAAVLESGPSLHVSPSREIKLKSNPSSGSEGGRRSDGDERKKKTTSGLMKLVDAISPKAGRKTQKDETTVQVWTNVGSQGSPHSLSIKLETNSSTEDLLKECLTKLQLTEDFRLYSILEIFPSNANGQTEDRELEMDEHPLEVQYMWPDHASCRFELRQRPAQGGAVKIVFHLAGQKPKGKLLSISLSTPASEVVGLGLRKFGMTNSDPRLFCLLEVDKFGDLHDVDDHAIPLQLDSHAFVLCDRSSKDAVATHSEEESSHKPADVRRNDSLTSRASSKVSFSGASLTSSHGSSSDLLSSRIDDEKLSKLEEEMNSIAEALSPRSEPVDVPDGVTSPGRGGQLEKTIQGQGSVDKDEHLKAQVNEQNDTIKTLRQHNQKLEEKAKQLLVVQAALSRLENTYRHEIAECHKRVSIPCDSDNLPDSVMELQQKLETANKDIVTKQRNIDKVKQEQQKQDGDAKTQDNLDSSIKAAELDYKLALEETSLVALQQDQARLFTKLELALADHQVAIEKGKSRKYRRPLYPILTPSSMQQHTVILPLHIDLALESHNLMLAANKDQKGVTIERCRSQSALKVGDRLIEVNGENVTRADIAEVNSCLNKSAKAQVVILREQPITLPDTANLAKMKQQLSLANQQLESSRRENSRMKEEVRRLRPLENQVVETTQLKATMQQLQNELAASQNRSEQIALELVAAQRTPRDKSYKETQREKERLEEEVDELKDTIFRLQESMEAKDSKLASVIHDRDAALERLREVDDSKPKQSAMIMNNDDEDLPLWESLKSANKSEILGVLQEEVEEAGRQKNYLDQLYTLMLEKAPELLNDLEEECEISEFSDNEEFC